MSLGYTFHTTVQRGVDHVQVAWEACPVSCTPNILGDLNINFAYPWNEWEKISVDQLMEINLILTHCACASSDFQVQPDLLPRTE